MSSSGNSLLRAVLVAGILGSTLMAVAQMASPAYLQTMTPEDLAKTLQSPKAEKPLILYVGPRMQFDRVHIAGAEYVGPGSTPEGQQALRERVKSLPRNKFIVIYCGCCAWIHCPNMLPASQLLAQLGFSKAKALYIATNTGTDWVAKGFPSVRGQ